MINSYLSFYWCRERLFGVPSVFGYSLTDCALTDSGAIRPCANWHRLAVVGQVMVVALVSALILLCRPPDVAGFIVPVNVNAINAVPASRPLADVGNEFLKRILPFLAHGNSTSPIERVVVIGDVKASRLNKTPRFVFGRSAHAVCLGSINSHLCAVATTTLSVSCSQCPCVGGNVLSAFAKASPHALLMFAAADIFCYCQSGEYAANQGYRRCNHVVNYTMNGRLVSNTGVAMSGSIYIMDGFTCDGKVDGVPGLHPAVRFKYRPAAYKARAEMNAAFTPEQREDAVAKVIHSHLVDVIAGDDPATRERVVLKLDDVKRLHCGIAEVMVGHILGSYAPVVEDELGKSAAG